MALKVVNKSRQTIPVSVVQGGQEVQVTLQSTGEFSSTVTEKMTTVVSNLVERELVSVREIPVKAQVEEEKKSNKR